jgi:Sensors of blue-light using FAD
VAVHPGTKVERDLLRLVYASAAAPALIPGDLESIAARSAERNRSAGLTGLLLHQGDRFYAILEGPRRRLFARMERIIIDPRHARVEVLLEAPIACRRFDNWRFGRLPGYDGAQQPAGDFLRSLSCRLK